MITEPAGSTVAAATLFPGLSPGEFAPALGHHPIAFRHALGDDARFSLAALAPLVAALPDRWVLANKVQYSPHEPRGLELLDEGADLDGGVRDLASTPASIRAYHLEHTGQFRDLHHELEPAVCTLVDRREGGVVAVNLGVFLASPDAVTPAHPDRHHNLLLQISGRKHVFVEHDPDHRAHHLRVVDYLSNPGAGAPVLPPACSFELGPGDGVYIPPYAFHWTTVLDGPAVGLSVGFSTPCTVRSATIHDFDVRLRRRGLRPRPCSPGGLHERWKARLASASVTAARVRGRLAHRAGRGTVTADQEGG